MAKKREKVNDEGQRQSRKEILIARRQQEQTRQIRIAVLAIVGLLVLVIVVGVINEIIIKPGSAVATVGGTEIAMADWQDRVRFQRSQLIIGIEDLAEAFNQDIGQVQQFAGQQISLLEDPESMGQFVLDELVDEELIRQEVDSRGIVISEQDVDKELEEAFGYYGGGVPTALPTATETPVPTPSITPIVTGVITEPQPTAPPLPTATSGPTSTPFPTSTPVSRESFQETLDETLAEFRDFGSSEQVFRDVIRARQYEERLLEELVIEEELSTEALHASFFYLLFGTEEEAQQALQDLDETDYISLWNSIKSQPREVNGDTTPATAGEVLWRTFDDVESLYGPDIAQAVFSQDLEEPSSLIIISAEESNSGSQEFYIVLTSGRGQRPLTEAAFNSAKQDLLLTWLEAQRQVGVEIYERWRGNVPSQPVLDRRFLLPPTPTPEIPEIQATPAG